MQKSERSSQMHEFKEKFLQLQQLEDVLGEILEMDVHRPQKYPKKVQDKPKTIHHNESKPIISDSQV